MKWKQSVLIIAALCIVSAMVLVMIYTQPREGKDGLPTSSSPEHNCSTSFITRDLVNAPHLYSFNSSSSNSPFVQI
jgi:uncharacterized protein YpmS